MRRAALLTLVSVFSLSGCNNHDHGVLVVQDGPPAPRALSASYYGGAVTVDWELAPDWNGEAFRVYSKRTTDPKFFFIAEVTSCSGGLCSYQDWNIVSDETYLYYVSAYDQSSGLETATADTVQVYVPVSTPPPVPTGPYVIALDGTNYITWDSNARSANDFSFYKVYLDDGGQTYLLGDTDSEGFLDQLAANGTTYSYFVSSVDTYGHESQGSVSASGTPRPDFHGEFMYDYFADPTMSGFRFQTDETTVAVGDGSVGADWDFRLETDANGSWLVPNSGTAVVDAGFTTALKCGVGADASCLDVSVAPLTGYTTADMLLTEEHSYVLRVTIGGVTNYGVIRVTHLGVDQNGDAIMIFDWAYQLQASNPNLAPATGG